MADEYDFKDEGHVRDVERVMLYIAEARQKARQIADALEKDGAEPRYVEALRDAAEALWAEHNRLLNRTHFYVTEEDWERVREQERRAAEDRAELDAQQQRMAV